MKEKLITEKSRLDIGDFSETSWLISFPEIERHLSDGWVIKQMSVMPYGVNGVKEPTDLVITAHLQQL